MVELVKPEEEIFSLTGVGDSESSFVGGANKDHLVFDAAEDLDIPSFLRNE